MTFHSMAETLNDIVDCRKVNIKTGFFRLNIEQRGALVEYLINACNRLYCDRFFAQWNWNENFGRGRKIDFTKLHEKIRTSQNFFGVYCEADVLGILYGIKPALKNTMLCYTSRTVLLFGIKSVLHGAMRPIFFQSLTPF